MHKVQCKSCIHQQQVYLIQWDKKLKKKESTQETSDEQLSVQLGSMGAAFFQSERQSVSFASFHHWSKQLGLIAHRARVHGGRSDQRQKQATRLCSQHKDYAGLQMSRHMLQCGTARHTHIRTTSSLFACSARGECVANVVVAIETMSEKTVFMEKVSFYSASTLKREKQPGKGWAGCSRHAVQPDHTSNAPGVPLLLLELQMHGPELWREYSDILVSNASNCYSPVCAMQPTHRPKNSDPLCEN